jgi:probable HAF family extracellular repeat protein
MTQALTVPEATMIRSLSLTALIALHLAAWNPTIAACSSSYTIDDLGTLGGTNSFGAAINAAGTVTGTSWLTSSAHAGGVHAFRYVDGIGMIDLGVLPNTGANFSFGYGINSFGQIAGGSYAAEAGTAIRAMMATATGLIDLGTLSNTDDASVAFDINDRGQVTGWSTARAGGAFVTHAFVWTAAAGMRDIGTLGGDYSSGQSINESGQIAGESKIGTGATLAFRFTEGAGMISLGTLSGGTRSSGYGINNSGQVVGESDTGPIVGFPRLKGQGPIVGFPRLKGRSFGEIGEGPRAFLWTEGVGMRDLGDLGGGTSRATAISNNGVVVGWSYVIDGAFRAFRWTQAEGMINLNTLLPPNSGWVLLEAYGVNDNGQITGNGLRNGFIHAFRLNPPKSTKPVTQLTVNKILKHPDHNHLRLFNLKIDGVTVKANINSGSSGPQTVSIGTHTVSETGAPSTPLSAFGTVIGGDCAADGTVTLAEGDNKICTITNYDHFGGCPTTCCEPGDGTEDCEPPHCSSACLRCSPPGGSCP